MAVSTQLVSGLSSGFDWRSMIDQLMAIEHRSVDLVSGKKSDYEAKLSEWRSFNTKLLSLKTASEGLKDPEDFNLYSSAMSTDDSAVKAADLLSVTTSSSASKGSYTIVIDTLASAQKLSSKSFSSDLEALGASYAGDILINGRVVNVKSTDSLADVRNKINNANAGTSSTGVNAAIVTYASNDYSLILTSDSTGAEGISLQNGSSSDLVQLFGWKDKSASLKNSMTGGAQSDLFTSSTQEIKTLLSLSTTQSGTIQIKDGNGVYQDVGINLSTRSLEGVKTAINNASIVGVTAAVVSETVGSSTKYRLQIDGSQDFGDSQNILETLGILQNGVSDVQGTTSGNSITENGQPISAATFLVDIDGYNQFTEGDKISLGAASRDHSGNDVSGDILTISENTTVQDLLEAIKTAYEANGDEVCVYLTPQGKIEVSDQESGASSLLVDLQSTIADPYSSLVWGSFTSLDEVRKRQLAQGTDASFRLDGVSLTSQDNSVDGIVPGITLSLLSADPETTVTLNINRDLDSIMLNIKGFAEAYNTVASYIRGQQSYDQDKGEPGGKLFGDGTLSSVKSDLTSALIRQIWGVSSELSTLGLVGINVDKEGLLSVNYDKLKGYLETNFNDIKSLFSANGSTDTGIIEYVSSSRDTRAGTFAVNITQVATQSATTSNVAVSGALGADEKLTIREGTRTASISLTSGMTISDMINAANAELDAVYTQRLVGTAALTSGSNPITSATTWESIDGANLVDGDIISFAGTSRNGRSVSGSYEIGQSSTDSVQSLLSAVALAFGNEIDATVDPSGHLVVTDKQQGDSQLSISFDYSQAHDLDFGSVATSTVGGQEGRYAIPITAGDDGSNHLVLRHNSYGSNYSFIVEEDTDTGLWTGSQTAPVEVDNGLDVAGTINGEAAEGSGQRLVGKDGEPNTDGLSIKYSGSSTGSVGNITLTLGTAELFERALYSITDTFEGYVTFKQESLQNSINGFETQMDQMEARLNKKMEMMINRFVLMELALSKMQSQSNWLSGQLTAAQNGWG